MNARLSPAEREVLARTLPDRNDLERIAAVVEAILLARQRTRLRPTVTERRFQRDYELKS